MAVRREAVRLELEDHFTREMLQAATAANALDESLDSLSGSAVRASRTTTKTEKDVDGLGKTSRKTGADIDRLSGRVAILAKVFGTLGPAISPVAAVGVAGIAGLASQLGFATAGALSLIVAAQGVGDALKAVEAARLEPTAANIEKAEEAMRRLAPEAQAFVMRFQELRPILGELQKAAARGWFPGLTEALDALESAAPRIARIMEAVSLASGNAVGAGAESLAGSRWADFLDFIEAEAPQAITDLSRTIGSLTHGLAELWMAFDPINDDVRDWLVDVADSFDDWAEGLDETKGFEEFVAYVRENGPLVADAAKAIGSAILEIGEAAAPLGGPVLDAIAAIADAIAMIADSPLGTPIMAAVTAMSALSLASRGLTASLGAANVQLKAMGIQGPRTAAALGMVQTAMLALVGIEVGTQVLDGIRDQAVGAAPSVDRLAASLLSVDASSLKQELGGSLSELLKARTSDLNGFESGVKGLSDKAGLFGDVAEIFVPSLKHMGVEAEQAEQATASLDRALVQMIATAGAAETRRAFDELAKSEGLSASAKRDLIGLLPGYTAALDAAGVAAAGAAGPTYDLTRSVEGLKAAYSNLSAVLDKQAAWDAYQAAIDNMTASVKENGKTLDANTEKGRANRAALNQIAESAVQFAEHLDEADRPDFLRDAIRNFKAGAAQAGGLDKRGRELLRTLRELAKAHADPKVTVETAAAKAALQGLRAQLDSIRDKDITVSTTFRRFFEGPAAKGTKGNRGGPIDPFRGAMEQASGGLVVGPGGPTDDMVPTWLSNQEYVMRASAVDRYGLAFFDALNAERLATGGQPGKKGKSRKNQDFLITPGSVLDQLDLSHFNRSLKGLVEQVEASKKAIEGEIGAREATIASLQADVTGKFTSVLFGDTDVWSKGGSLADAIAALNGDTAGANAESGAIAKLRSLGLSDNGAMSALLSEADPATVANIAATATAQELATYQQAYQARVQANANLAAQATAGWAAEAAGSNARLDVVINELRTLNGFQKTAPAATGRAAAGASKKGTGKAMAKARRG